MPPQIDGQAPESARISDALRARVASSTLTVGVVLALLGGLSLAAPWGAATAIDIACGVALAVAGIAQIGLSASAFNWRGFWLALLCGSLSLMAGTAMLAIPRAGIEAIVVFVGLVLLFESAAKFTAAWAFRDVFPAGWMLVDGLLTAVLGGILFTARPDNAGTLLGVLVGINLLSSGLMFAATGWTLKRLASGGPGLSAGR